MKRMGSKKPTHMAVEHNLKSLGRCHLRYFPALIFYDFDSMRLC